jgi:hypothetical protein
MCTKSLSHLAQSESAASRPARDLKCLLSLSSGLEWLINGIWQWQGYNNQIGYGSHLVLWNLS